MWLVQHKLYLLAYIIIIGAVLIVISLSIQGNGYNFAKGDLAMSSKYAGSKSRQRSLLSPELQWCSSNPFLVDFDPTKVMDLEQRWLKWSKNQLSHTYNALMNYIISSTSARENIIKLAYPTSLPLPCFSRYGFKRYGSGNENGKILCGVETLKRMDSCVIHSLGSNNQFEFEKDLSRHTSCKIYTYDCTSSPPQESIERLKYFSICLGRQVELQNHIFPVVQHGRRMMRSLDKHTIQSYRDILRKNNHTKIHILKMDVEAGEYSVFADLFQHADQVHLPYQIVFESHWWDSDIYHAIMHQQMFAQLWKHGYRFMKHEVNPDHRACVEWTLMRVFC